VVSVDRDELDLAGFVEGLESDPVLVVEVGLLELEEVSFGVHLLEPLTLVWVDHGVLGEGNEHEAIEGGESLLVEVALLSLFVVDVWQEAAVLQVGVEVLWVSVVSSWSNHVLDQFKVGSVLSTVVNPLAEDSRLAVWDGLNTHVWSSDREQLLWNGGGVALLNNISGNESSLRKTTNIEVSLEVWVGLD